MDSNDWYITYEESEAALECHSLLNTDFPSKRDRMSRTLLTEHQTHPTQALCVPTVMTMKLVFVLLVTQLAVKIDGQTNCLSPEIKSCRDCISASSRCVWCADPGLTSSSSRCNTKDHWKRTNCANVFGEKESHTLIIREDREFTNKMDKTVQLKPQKVDVSLRAESAEEVNIVYRQAEDYPMDLYYLMDLSCTMLKHKDQLAKVGGTLAQAMKQTTNNFRIGFGSYVDKPVMPYSAFNIQYNLELDPRLK